MNNQVNKFLDEMFSASELNLLPQSHAGGRIFSTPLMGVSSGDDPIFQKYKEVVAPEHLTPAEMWAQSGLPEIAGLPERLRILSIVFPFEQRIREQSKEARKMPAEIYSIGRNFANDFMADVLKQTVKFFQENGFNAVAGMLSPAFQLLVKDGNPIRIYSVWSERHMAFAAGLGTFSLHEGLITEAGCNVRVSSVITDAPLEVTPRKSDEPYGNCLFYAKGACRECEKRCPGDAINQSGHDKLKCYVYGRVVEKQMRQRLGSILKPHYRKINDQDNTSYPVGCAFCQFGTPCMDKNPMAKEQEKEQTD